MGLSSAEIAQQIRYLAAAEKTVAVAAYWVPPMPSENMASLVLPLAVEGVPQAGLTLQILVPFQRSREFQDLRAMMFATLEKRRWHIGRIEPDPPGDGPHHFNPMQACKTNVHLLPSVTGPHAHLVEDNLFPAMQAEAFNPTNNMPAARQIKPVAANYELCSVIEELYHIEGFWFEGPVPWRQQLI